MTGVTCGFIKCSYNDSIDKLNYSGLDDSDDSNHSRKTQKRREEFLEIQEEGRGLIKLVDEACKSFDDSEHAKEEQYVLRILARRAIMTEELFEEFVSGPSYVYVGTVSL